MRWLLFAILLIVFQPEIEAIEFDGVHFEYPVGLFENVEASHFLRKPVGAGELAHVYIAVEGETLNGEIMIFNNEVNPILMQMVSFYREISLPPEEYSFAREEITGDEVTGTRALRFVKPDTQESCETVNPSQLEYMFQGQSEDERFAIYARFSFTTDLIEDCDDDADYKALAELDVIFSTMRFDDDALAELKAEQLWVDDVYVTETVISYALNVIISPTIDIPLTIALYVDEFSTDEGGEGLRLHVGERYGEIIAYMVDDYLTVEDGCDIELLQEILDEQPEEPELGCLAPEYTDLHYLAIPEGNGLTFLTETDEGTFYHFIGLGYDDFVYIEANIPVLDEALVERMDEMMQSLYWPKG